MPLQSSGTIALSQVRQEHGGPTSYVRATAYYRDPSNNPSASPYVQSSNKSPPTYSTVTGYHPGTPQYCGRTCYTNCSTKCPSNPPKTLTSGIVVGGGFNCGPGQKPSHSQYGGVFYCDPAQGKPAVPGGTYSYTVLTPGVVSPANQSVPLSGTIKWSDWYGSYKS